MAKFSPKPQTLPDKPSELIRTAIHDITLVERQKAKYVVNMGVFHSPSDYSGKCQVCYAGAVMAKTLGCNPKDEVETDHWGNEVEGKLDALDSFRTGDVEDAFSHLGIDLPEELSGQFPVVSYSSDPKKFKEQQNRLADLLEVCGH